MPAGKLLEQLPARPGRFRSASAQDYMHGPDEAEQLLRNPTAFSHAQVSSPRILVTAVAGYTV